MAPALLGQHKSTICPCCRHPVCVGVIDTAAPSGKTDPMWGACCPNCGCGELELEGQPVSVGEQLLVNRCLFDLRRPRRWEMAVFLSPLVPLRAFVKRVVGLPGESIQLREGDVYIDHDIARKTLAQAKAMRIPVFDGNYIPAPDGWNVRWEGRPPGGLARLQGNQLHFMAGDAPEEYLWLVYHHTLGTSDKARPLLDEYAYNSADPERSAEPVHDFLIECDLKPVRGDGWIALGISDGGSEIVVELPVGPGKDGVRLREVLPYGSFGGARVFRTAPECVLQPGRTCHVDFAFVDRRASLAVDGREVFVPVDRPVLEWRCEVVRPVRLGARGVDVIVSNFRLFRDIHYMSQGPHAVAKPVSLGSRQYFVLGDNSASSDDSRFWSDPDGKPLPVPETDFLGKPFLVHLPVRTTKGSAGWASQGIDWVRIRWLR
jgi:signal peptidase I